MEIIPESMPATAPAPQYLPRFADGTVNLQELNRSMAEMLANEIMSAEADQLCDATGNSMLRISLFHSATKSYRSQTLKYALDF